MRISSNQYHNTMISALQLANDGVNQALQQLATGQRILKPSDDPIGTLRLSRLSREEAALGQYRDNIGALQSRLSNSEATLDSVQGDLQSLRDLLVWAADGGNTPADLNAMSGSLQTLQESLLYLANTKNAEGRYLFSGTASDQPTVIVNAGPPVTYTAGGNTQTQPVAVADNTNVPANVSLQEMAPFLQQLSTLTAQLASPTVTASGVQASVQSMIAQLDQTMGSVASKIGQLGGRQNVINTLDGNQASVSLSNQQSALKIGKTDYAESSTRLESYKLAVQATQKAYASVSELSLFDVIR